MSISALDRQLLKDLQQDAHEALVKKEHDLTLWFASRRRCTKEASNCISGIRKIAKPLCSALIIRVGLPEYATGWDVAGLVVHFRAFGRIPFYFDASAVTNEQVTA